MNFAKFSPFLSGPESKAQTFPLFVQPPPEAQFLQEQAFQTISQQKIAPSFLERLKQFIRLLACSFRAVQKEQGKEQQA